MTISGTAASGKGLRVSDPGLGLSGDRRDRDSDTAVLATQKDTEV